MSDPTTPSTDPQPLHSTDQQSQANAALGLYGITGTGKTSLAITACEEAWEVYHKVTHWYSSDLGGWGTKLLSLIKLGIVRVWYLRNHINPFETMELASQGYWPEALQDPDTGLAAPDVRLVAPRQVQWLLICPNGHPTKQTFAIEGQVRAANVTCPECGQITSAANAQRIDRLVVRSKGFKHVGHYVFDSMTQMSEYGQVVLRDKSARGELPSSSTGGSALGSADAVREGTMAWGTGSKAQVGFMQDRVPVWIANIRAIPDQVLPPVITFGVEQSRGDDESGGQPLFAPKIAGNARTSSVPGWLGNCLYATKEPHNPPETNEHGVVQLYHRLWLTTHVDPRDGRAIPIVAKHRGEPFGMPAYLEDPLDPEKAWSVCSLREFYRLLREQQQRIEQRDQARYGSGALALDDDAQDEIIAQGAASDTGPAIVPTPSRIIKRHRPSAGPAAAPAPVATAQPQPQPQPRQEPAGSAGMAAAPPAEPAVTLPAPAATTPPPTPAVAATNGGIRRIKRPGIPTQPIAAPAPAQAAAEAKPAHVQQMEASLAAQQAQPPQQPPAQPPPVAVAGSPVPPPTLSGAPTPVVGGGGVLPATAQVPPAVSSAAPAALQQTVVNRIRRMPRPS